MCALPCGVTGMICTRPLMISNVSLPSKNMAVVARRLGLQPCQRVRACVKRCVQVWRGQLIGGLVPNRAQPGTAAQNISWSHSIYSYACGGHCELTHHCRGHAPEASAFELFLHFCCLGRARCDQPRRLRAVLFLLHEACIWSVPAAWFCEQPAAAAHGAHDIVCLVCGDQPHISIIGIHHERHARIPVGRHMCEMS
jgi:hypothetical protein